MSGRSFTLRYGFIFEMKVSVVVAWNVRTSPVVLGKAAVRIVLLDVARERTNPSENKTPE
jgi:hypothetical protein